MHGPIVTTVAATLVSGVACQAFARRIKLPAIVPLLLVGFVLGPNMTNIVRPRELGGGLNVLVGFAVSIILFEGGLSLKMESFRLAGRMIRNLVFLGAAVTWLLSAGFCAALFQDVPISLCLLFGALVIVTGPTVIAPLLKAIHARRKVADILRGEAILIDPVGALCAVMVLEYVLGTQDGAGASAFVDLLARVGLGIALGGVGAWCLNHLLRRQETGAPDLQNLTVLSGAIGLFAVSEAVLGESGVLTVTLSGFLLGWMNPPGLEEVEEFKGHMTVLMVSMVFILLAADIDWDGMLALGWPGVLLVLSLILVVRPLSVFLCAIGAGLSWREKLFLSWIAPRGIVAAAVSSLFALQLTAQGFAEGEIVKFLTFAVIVGTVVIQGPTARPVARLLGVLELAPNGFLIVGGNLAGRSLARALVAAKFNVLVVDTNPWAVRQARDMGLTARKGNALDDVRMEELDTDGVGYVLSLTSNHDVNRLVERFYAPSYGRSAVRAIRTTESPPRMPNTHEVPYLFGDRLTWEQLEQQLVAGATIDEALIDEPVTLGETDHWLEGRTPLLAFDRKQKPKFLENNSKLVAGDTLFFLAAPGSSRNPTDKADSQGPTGSLIPS